MASPPPAKKIKVNHDGPSTSHTHIFSGFCAYFVEQGIGKVRCNILKRQMENHGGCVEKGFTSHTTHIFINKGLKKEKLLKILKRNEVEKNIKILLADWLSACLVKGEVIKENGYVAYPDNHIVENDLETKEDDTEENKMAMEIKVDKDKNCIDRLDTNDSDMGNKKGKEMKELRESKPGFSGDANIMKEHFSKEKYTGISTEEVDTENPSKEVTSNYKTFVCARPSTSGGGNFNKHITDKLQILQDEYTSTQDRWRAFGYKKAIASITKYHKPLETYEEVLKLPFVGERLAKKVWEIMETGHLQRLDHVAPKMEIIKLFSGVWGAGPKTAEQWVARGFKSLEDLPEDELTFQQKIGVKHYIDINEKMPRTEVSEIEKLIRNYAEDLLPGVLLVVCGSYRRGRAFCGDIDILVSHPDGKSHEGFLFSLLNKLKEVKLITDDLITVENEAQRKYMGLCKLPDEGSRYRRIDFIAAPYHEWPCALLHFTGSAHFNRSIRRLAKKKNMSLSEHALRKNVVRGQAGEKVNKGQVVPISSEADVFKYLELDYLDPTERDW